MAKEYVVLDNASTGRRQTNAASIAKLQRARDASQNASLSGGRNASHFRWPRPVPASCCFGKPFRSPRRTKKSSGSGSRPAPKNGLAGSRELRFDLPIARSQLFRSFFNPPIRHSPQPLRRASHLLAPLRSSDPVHTIELELKTTEATVPRPRRVRSPIPSYLTTQYRNPAYDDPLLRRTRAVPRAANSARINNLACVVFFAPAPL